MTATVVSTREDDLVCSILDLIEKRNQQKNTDERKLVDGFPEAVDDCIEMFEAGDVPRDCQKIFLVVLRMKSEWLNFEVHFSPVNWQPTQPFWTCIDELENELTFAPPTADLEFTDTIASFRKENLTDRQIAVCFSWNGVGPFMKAGIPQPALVKAEEAKPGSVLGKDFVHPMVQDARDRAARYSNRLAKRADELRVDRPERTADSASPIGPESIEELVLQKVPDAQIMKIKRCTLAEVNEVKAEIEARMAGKARGPVDAADQAEVESQIAAWLAEHPNDKNADIAEVVGCEVRAVAQVRNKLKSKAKEGAAA